MSLWQSSSHSYPRFSILGKYKRLSKKKLKAGDIKRRLTGDGEISPFASIKLVPAREEKKTERKKAPAKIEPKKPSEIVQGYNPSSSFADILYAYEHTGNPYAMPSASRSSEIARKHTDFGSILDKWEGRGKAKTAKKPTETKKSSYKPTKSFGDILSSYEGRPSEKPMNEKDDEIVEDITDESPLFRKETDDEKKSKEASWSIFGGRNEDFVRKEEPEVSEKREDEKPKRASMPYKATRDFGEILSSFEEQRKPEKKQETTRKTESHPVKEESVLSDNLFCKEREDERRSPDAVWSVFGNNRAPERRKSENVDAEEKEETPSLSVYQQRESFSSTLSQYEKRAPEKTFDEIMKEKEEKREKPQLTISKLRTMMPQSTLDLHGYTLEEAEKAVKAFLDECVENKLRKISIITGKGLHSEDGKGVLRDAVSAMLDSSDAVREKNSAPLSAGGSGALWIILKETQRSL